MSKLKITVILLVLMSILLIVPTAFAQDNQTSLGIDSNASDVLTADYYFDAGLDNDKGNGSEINPYKDLTAGRIKSNSNIYLSNGEYDLKSSLSITNVSIIGQDSTKTVINGKSLTSYSTLILKNLTLVGMNIVNKGNITAENVIFVSAPSQKSIINSVDKNLYINLNNCTFRENNADFGAAIYIINGHLNINNSLFENNYVKNFGGAIFSLNSYVTIDNSIFRRNNASYDGGSIYAYGRSLSLTNSIFENSYARNGGGIFASGLDSFIINSNKFISNNAENNGGAVYSIINEIYYDSIENHSLNNSFINNSIYELNFHDNIFIGNNEYILIKYNQTDSETLPDRYDLRDYGYVTSVKNQGGGGNCWSFAALSALESSILKASGYNYDLSEDNMKNLMALYSVFGWAMEPNVGGYDKMGVGYLTSWLGPVNESDDIYSPTSIISPILNSFVHVQNIQFLSRSNYTDNYAIKKAIYDYGAVATSIYWQSAYSNGASYYFDGTIGANHAVTIVGWDDSYSKSNFKTEAPGDGAWIIKNSWGTGSGDKGFYYVSYYDTKLAPINRSDVSYVIILNDTLKYDKNYQYDIPGRTDFFLNESNTVWYKNIFKSTDNEYLTAVSTYFEKQTSWNLSVYVNNVLKHVQSGISKASYSTIQLDQFIPLKKGDLFEIVFNILVDKEAGVPVCEEVSLNKLLFANNISFISYDGINWTDIYNLEWKYSSHSYNTEGVSVACIKAFTILNPVNTNIVLDIERHEDNTVDIIATVYNEYGSLVPSGTVIFNDDVCADVVNGIAKFCGMQSREGINNVSAMFNATGFVSSKNNISFYGKLINSTIEINSTVFNSNPAEIVISVFDQYNNLVKSGILTVTVENVNYTVDITDGIGKIEYLFKNTGLNNISVYYFDGLFYGNSSLDFTADIKLKETIISLSVDNEFNPLNIIAKVSDTEGNIIKDGNVSFIIDDILYNISLVNGTASVEHVYNVTGMKNISAVYLGSNIYLPSTGNISVNVLKRIIDFSINISKNINNVTINVTASENSNDTIIVYLNDNTHEFILKNGSASFSFANLDIGNYTVKVKIQSYIYDSLIISDNFVVNDYITKIIASDINTYLNDQLKYSVQLVDLNGRVIPNQEIVLSANGKSYTNKTDNNGIAVFYLNLTSISNDLLISFNGNENYTPASAKSKITFKSIILSDNLNYAYNSDFTAYLLDKNTQPLKNKEVTIKIGVKNYIVKTDDDGKINYNLLLSPGTYMVSLINPDSDESVSQEIKVVSRITKNTALTMYYGAGKYYKVRVCDDDGKFTKGLKVTFSVNGKTYTRLTDENGYASLKISLKVGKYTIKASYKGYSVSNKITVKTTLITKDKTVKKGKTLKFTVKLLNKNGKIIKNKKITIKFKGKTYKVKTNSKGIATLKIKMKYKAGSYTIKSTYGGLTVKNKIKIKK